MSVSRLFTVIGDGNVRRNMTGLNIASRETMKSAQVVQCSGLGGLVNSLAEVRAESSVCIFASITELFLAAEDCGTIASTVDNVLHVLREKLDSFCRSRPTAVVAVAPPLYRHTPFWYQKHLHEIAGRFSNILTESSPPNLHLLPSFVTQELLPDGHLTPVSGLHYVLHLFDQTEVLLLSLASTSDVQLIGVKETCRQQGDRLTFIEHRHRQIDEKFDTKIAVDAEFSDWLLNRSEEDWFMMQNHPRLPESTSREWQIAAKKQVNEIIKLVLHTTRVRVDYAILYVANPLRGRNSGQTIYNVRLNSVEASKRIRDLYSGFFKKNSPVKLPSSLKGISIRNKVTHETRVRIAILRQLGINYEARNPGGSYQLRGYDSRPLLLTFPPSGDSGSRPRTFNFIQAVTSLPTELSDTNLAYIHQVLGTRNPGQLQAIYVVLRDDDRERCDALVVQHCASQRGLSGQSVGPSATSSRTFSGSGSGMAAQALGSMLLMPPPPPPVAPRPEVSFKDRSDDKSPKGESPKVRRFRSRSRSRSPKDRRSRSRSRSRSPKGRRSRTRSRSRSPRSQRDRRSRTRSRSRSPASRRGRKNRRVSSSPEAARKKSSKRKKRARTPSSSGSDSSSSRSPTPSTKFKKKR